MRQAIVAPHLGVWSALPPSTDNPAARRPPCPQHLRAHLAVLRAEAHARYAEAVRRAPHVWHWGR